MCSHLYNVVSPHRRQQSFDLFVFLVMELSAVGLVQGGGPEQGASSASMASSATMAEVEKKKSFADMKLVDFTSGFSNFEVS